MGLGYRMALGLILVIVASALSGGGPQGSGQVEQTPAGEQCKADADLWLAESNVYGGDFSKMRDSLKNLTLV